jgi:hypothetical protein
MMRVKDNLLRAFSAVLTRAGLMARLGKQYDGDRNIYEALGYPLTTPSYEDFLARYYRQSIARAVIDRPVEATWAGEFGILESEDDKETALEKGWQWLEKAHQIKSKFVRLDKLTCIGHYGILLLGLDDVTSPEMVSREVTKGKRKLLYVNPLGEGSATIKTWEENPKSERYGLPVSYELKISAPGNADRTTTLMAHHSRVIHVAGETLESECVGSPVLEPILNRLIDLEKLVGGSAEMFWRGARPGYQGKIDDDYELTTGVEEDLKGKLDEFEHNLRRIMVNKGITFEAMAPQVADPTPHITAQLQMISAVVGIPLRILTGSERGELASSQDRSSWFDLIVARRGEYAGPRIVYPCVDRLIKYGVLPASQSEEEGYTIDWQDPYAPSDKEKAEIGRIRAEALRAYATSPTAEAILPADAFLEFFLGLSSDDITLIGEMREEAQAQEEELQRQLDEELQKQEEEQRALGVEVPVAPTTPVGEVTPVAK